MKILYYDMEWAIGGGGGVVDSLRYMRKIFKNILNDKL